MIGRKKTTTASGASGDRAAIAAQKRQASADIKSAKAVKAHAKAKQVDNQSSWQKQHGARHGILLFNKKAKTTTKATKKKRK